MTFDDDSFKSTKVPIPTIVLIHDLSNSILADEKHSPYKQQKTLITSEDYL